MRHFKYFLFLLITLSVSTGLSAQKSSKLEQRVAEKITKLEKQIQAGNSELTFSAEQRTELTAVLTAMFKDIRQVKKAGGKEDVIKEQQQAVRKEAYGKIHKEIMTKEQRKAKRAGMDKKE